MWWVCAAMAGGMPAQLDKAVSKWFGGVTADKAFKKFDVRLRPGLRQDLVDAGADRLHFVGMELQLQMGPHLVRLMVDPRKPVKPVMVGAQVVQGEASRGHAMTVWDQRAPEISDVVRDLAEGMTGTDCPAYWRAPDMSAYPALVRDQAAREAARVAKHSARVCRLLSQGHVDEVMVDDLAWMMFGADGPIGVLTGELELRPEGLMVSLGELRMFR